MYNVREKCRLNFLFTRIPLFLLHERGGKTAGGVARYSWSDVSLTSFQLSLDVDENVIEDVINVGIIHFEELLRLIHVVVIWNGQ